MRPVVEILVFFAIYLAPIIFAQEKNTAVPVVVGIELADVQNDDNNNSKVDIQENKQGNVVQNDTAVDKKQQNLSINEGFSNSQNNQSNNKGSKIIIVVANEQQNLIKNNTSQNNETIYNLSSGNTTTINKHYLDQNAHNNQTNVSTNVDAKNEQEIDAVDKSRFSKEQNNNIHNNETFGGNENNSTENKYNNVEANNDQNTANNETNNKGLGSYAKNEEVHNAADNKYKGESANLNEEPQINQSIDANKSYINNTSDNKLDNDIKLSNNSSNDTENKGFVSYLKKQREYVVDIEHDGESTNINEKNKVQNNASQSNDTNIQSHVNNTDNEQKQATDNNKEFGSYLKSKQENLTEGEEYAKTNKDIKNNAFYGENTVNKHKSIGLGNFKTTFTNIEVHVKNIADSKQKQAHDIESSNVQDNSSKNEQEDVESTKPNKDNKIQNNAFFHENTVHKHKPAGLSNFQDNQSTDNNNKDYLNDDNKNTESSDLKASKSNVVYDNVVRAVLANKDFYFQNEQALVGSGKSDDNQNVSHNIQIENSNNQTKKSSNIEGFGYQNNKADIRSDQKETANNLNNNNQTKIYFGLLNENIENPNKVTNNEEYKLAVDQNLNKTIKSSDINGPSLHIDNILGDDEQTETETEIHTELVNFHNNHGVYNVGSDNSNTFQDSNAHFYTDEIIQNSQATTDGLYEIASNKNLNEDVSGNDNNDAEEDYDNTEEDKSNFKQEEEYNKISSVNRWQEKLEELRKHIEKIDVAAREEERINYINKMIAYRVHVLENFRQKYGITIGCDSELCRLSCIIYWFKSGYCPKRSTCLCV